MPTPPFWGDRMVKGIALADYRVLPGRAGHIHGSVGPQAARGGTGPSYEELVETEGRPRLRSWLDRIQTEGVAEAAVVYGYWPVLQRGEILVVLNRRRGRRPSGARFQFPRQRRPRYLCLADFFRAVDVRRGPDVVAFHLVTMGARVAGDGKVVRAERLPGLSRAARAERPAGRGAGREWHARIRSDLGFATDDGKIDDMIRDQAYRGSRYSFGYPACPDLEDRAKLVALLRPERIGVELSEELQLHPEQSTDALVVHHPEAKYFNAR